MKLNRQQQTISKFRGQHYFLSNFFACRIEWNGRLYKTVEHLYQASKATNDKDHEAIRLAPKPGDSKRIGRKIKIRNDWEEIKVEVMRNALMMKFVDPKLEMRLLNTKNATLIEGNSWHDNFWGWCECKECEPKVKYNILGALLMELRFKLGIEYVKE